MGLDATTFVLEIVNFLVLLWLLHRFLYRPVQTAIARRQQQADEARQALEAQRAELDARQRELEQAHASFDRTRASMQQDLAAEIAAERTRQLEALRAELVDERTKAHVRLEAEHKQEARRQEAAAAQRAQSLVRRYLERLAGPELERAITGLFLSDLAALEPAARDRLRADPVAGAIEIATAYATADTARRDVESALLAALGRPVPARWTIDPALIAGISVRLDGQLLEASLARALAAFQPAASAPA